MNKQNLADKIYEDPRGRNEVAWLDTLDFLVSCLARATMSHLHIGTYWCIDESGHSTASIVSRIRSRTPLAGVESDYWEGALCYSGGKEGAYADAFLFPFHNNSPVVSTGILAKDAELDEFRWWQLDNCLFVDRGWSYPDGLGEWGWMKKPGDEYWQTVNVQTNSTEYHEGEPILVDISNIEIPYAQSRNQPTARISLIHANRDRENTNLYPWGSRPPGPASDRAFPISARNSIDSQLKFDLSQFRIRGGWIPGKYHISIRVQNCRNPADWSYTSDISAPFKITILPKAR